MDLIPGEKAVAYQTCQALFQENLPGDATLFNEYHALLDRHAKEACTKVPKCDGCCLRDICDTGTGRLAL